MGIDGAIYLFILFFLEELEECELAVKLTHGAGLRSELHCRRKICWPDRKSLLFVASHVCEKISGG